MRYAIFASGNGTNAEALFAWGQAHTTAEISCLICDQPDAHVVKRAEKWDIPGYIIPFSKDKGLEYKKRKENHEREIHSVLKKYNIDWICLAGYMRILSSEFIDSYKDSGLGYSRILNIHPSLLPAFKGKQGYVDAFNSGVKISGVTVHLVTSGVDEGPILGQESFPRLDSDTIDTFTQRGREVELRLYPKVMDSIESQTFEVQGQPQENGE